MPELVGYCQNPLKALNLGPARALSSKSFLSRWWRDVRDPFKEKSDRSKIYSRLTFEGRAFQDFFLRPFKFKKRVWKDEIGESLLISLGTEAEFLPHPPLRPLRWVPLRWKRIKCWVSTKKFSIKSVKSFPRWRYRVKHFLLEAQ